MPPTDAPKSPNRSEVTDIILRLNDQVGGTSNAAAQADLLSLLHYLRDLERVIDNNDLWKEVNF